MILFPFPFFPSPGSTMNFSVQIVVAGEDVSYKGSCRFCSSPPPFFFFLPPFHFFIFVITYFPCLITTDANAREYRTGFVLFLFPFPLVPAHLENQN